jgi:acyl-CoA synthetase (AMP-forming)/AMP-acid ligase II
VNLARNLIQRINVGDSLTRSAAARPDQLAVVDGPRRWTYVEFNAWVNQLARGLAARGYERGDALGLASANSAEFLAVYYACAKLGLVCVPINLGWRPDEVAYVLDHSGARGLVAESQLIAHVRDAVAKVSAVADVFVAPGTGAGYEAEPADRSWSSLAELAAGSGSTAEPERFVDDRDAISYLYTSGTTSFPKGVVGTHVAIYTESMSSALDSGWNSTDRFAAMMPMFHTAQLNAFCTPAIMVGATIHVLRGFDPGALLDLVEREQITQAFGLPMMFRAMLDQVE